MDNSLASELTKMADVNRNIGEENENISKNYGSF